MTALKMPALLTGTEPALVAKVPGAGGRWSQVHFNVQVTRRFFGLTEGSTRSITLERIGSNGTVVARIASRLVMPESNRNSRIEFDFHPLPRYPSKDTKPIVVVIDAGNLTYRYRLLMPGDGGYEPMRNLLAAGPSEGRGVNRRIVTLDEVEGFWPQAMLRGGI